MKRWICSLICALMAILSALQAEYLDIESAYKQILLYNDGLKSTQSAVDKQEKLDSATKMIYLPQISLDGVYVRLQEPMNAHLFNNAQLAALGGSPALAPLAPLLSHLAQPITLQDNNIIFGALNIVYPIFTGGRKYFANKLSKIALQDAFIALKLKELSLFEDCVRLYYGVVLSNQILSTLTSANAGHLTHYQNALKLQEKGQIARIEALQAQVNYDKSSIDVQKADNNLKIASLALNAILNRESHTTLELTQSIDIKQDKALQPLEHYTNKALEIYPALQLMDNKIKAANELTNIEFASFLPEVALFGSYMFHDNSSLLDKAMPNWYAGVGARWSLLSPNGRIQKYQASKIATIEAQFATAQARKDLKTLCEKTYSEVQAYKTQYFSLSSSIELAEENLKLRQKAFSQGLGTTTEVSDAQNALSLAIIERQSIAYNYALALARLLALSDEIEQFYAFFN
ncbi:TolC family protein [Helicobacter jaachi]|uniref:TolC family protein n=1 Tax=Helicobacter jaachi TaxID=1677920 RepID=A0A4U8TAI7_9HELI|nr:TolC family protein [Helicobacter jaachi]TLD96723.1 TolC family protein [Helicobacter jaachi]